MFNVDLALIQKALKENSKSDLSIHERRLIALMRGDKPKNQSERVMKKQIAEISVQGGIVEIPHM